MKLKEQQSHILINFSDTFISIESDQKRKWQFGYFHVYQKITKFKKMFYRM